MFNFIVDGLFIHLSIGATIWMFGYCSGRLENAVTISAAQRGQSPTRGMMFVASLVVITAWPAGIVALIAAKHHEAF